jgi:hypothetical protein
MPVCDFCKNTYEGDWANHPCPVPALTPAVIGMVAPFLPLQALGQLAKTSRAGDAGVKAITEPAREMLSHNGFYSAKKGAPLRSNYFGEGVAARLLKAIDPTYRAWDVLSPEERRPFSAAFPDSTPTKPSGLTPDYVVTLRGRARVADAFSVNYPSKSPRRPATQAVDTISQVFVPKVTEKWNKYGDHSVAIANVGSFPDEVSTEVIIGAIRTAGAQTFPTYAGKGNLLYLVRDPLIKEIALTS